MSKVKDFLAEAGVFFLATVDGSQPKLRPLGAFLETDGKLLFGVGDFKNVYRQMTVNPLVELVACKPNGHWLRYTGRAQQADGLSFGGRDSGRNRRDGRGREPALTDKHRSFETERSVFLQMLPQYPI